MLIVSNVIVFKISIRYVDVSKLRSFYLFILSSFPFSFSVFFVFQIIKTEKKV